MWRAEDEELEALWASLVASPRAGRDAHRIPRSELLCVWPGVWVFGGGLHPYEEVSVVATDGTVSDGPPESKAYIGGFSVVDGADTASSHDSLSGRPAPAAHSRD